MVQGYECQPCLWECLCSADGTPRAHLFTSHLIEQGDLSTYTQAHNPGITQETHTCIMCASVGGVGACVVVGHFLDGVINPSKWREVAAGEAELPTPRDIYAEVRTPDPRAPGRAQYLPIYR